MINRTRLQKIQRQVRKLPLLRNISISHEIDSLTVTNMPEAAEPIAEFTMATLYGTRSDGCGTVGCLAGLTILEYPHAANRIRDELADKAETHDTLISGISGIDIAGQILGLDEDTRDELFHGESSGWGDDLERMPKAAVLRAIDNVLAGKRSSDIWTDVHPPE